LSPGTFDFSRKCLLISLKKQTFLVEVPEISSEIKYNPSNAIIKQKKDTGRVEITCYFEISGDSREKIHEKRGALILETVNGGLMFL
jgi:hypothetical protein